MSTLICGSMAFDTIMVFHDRFHHHILPEKIHRLSVSFMVPDLRREFGGTAGNIAYNLKLLGGNPIILATVGQDFGPYQDRLEKMALDTRGVRTLPDSYTAQAFITTDLDDNQITAFHPGAMNFSHLNDVSDFTGIRLGVVSPDGKEGMIQHAEQFHRLGIPFLFDPGQGLPMFSGTELLTFLDLASHVAVNDYEAQLLCEKTGYRLDQLAERVEALIVTLGASGSTIYNAGREIAIPPVAADAVVDPTGCGDAFRAGLIYGLTEGWEWEKSGRLASLMGALKIAHRGGQNHHYTREALVQRFESAFGLSWID